MKQANKGWVYVLIAGIIEILWVSGLKHSAAWWEWALTVIAIGISFVVVIRAAKILPVGTVYAVFAGIGTAGTVLTEMLLFGEPFNIVKILLVLVLLSGVIGLKLVTGEKEKEANA